MDLSFVAIAALSGLLLSFVRWFISPYIQYKMRSRAQDYELTENGKTFIQKQEIGTPFLLREAENARVGLSLVVPAFNEQDRLPHMLKSHIQYMQEQQKAGTLPSKIEILVVDDGSRDVTWTIIKQWCAKTANDKDIRVRGFRQKQNKGKGMAVKNGMLYSKGDYVLMVDADGATDFKEIPKIYQQCVSGRNKEGLSCAIGSRNHPDNAGQVQRKGIRKLLNFCLTTLIRFVLGFSIQDTQCGFKIFTREAAKRVFPT